MESSNPHLLVSVFLSPVGLNQQKYDLKFAESNDDHFHRLGRFFSSLKSLTVVPWETIRVYFDTAEIWNSQKTNITKNIRELFPSAEIHEFRLSRRREWQEVSELYKSDQIIYLHTNDDHAFVAPSIDELMHLCAVLRNNPRIEMGAVTHFPEMTGMLTRRYLNRKKSKLKRVVKVNSAIGTTLCRGDFFKTWWEEGTFKESEIIVRPDNPLGRQVTFVQANLLIPNHEIIRHMDGYSHVKIMKPLTPIRNTYRYLPGNSIIRLDETWVRDFWPKKLFTLVGSGVDLHLTYSKPSDCFTVRYRSGVAHLQSYWLLRISFTQGFKILKNDHQINPLFHLIAIGSALTNVTILLNLIDKIVDLPLIVLLKLIEKRFKQVNKIKSQIIYLGSWRTLVVSISRNRIG
jgi:hypothetical protein